MSDTPDRPYPAGTTGATRPLAPLGTAVRIGPYRVLDEIGHGGMGVVYLAEQVHPVRRRVALKLIRGGMNSRDVIARFDAERQALALMNHRNIATVFDAGETDDGQPYIAMEYVDGPNLIDYCDMERLPLRERLRLFIQVCRAIHHAHQNAVIHRDVSPGNILVAMDDGMPVPKIIDFGIAKSLSQPLTDLTVYTQRNLIIGKPAYMPPEQLGIVGGPIDATADIYALGILLYELLVGALPLDLGNFQDGGVELAFSRLINEEPPVPSKRVGQLGDRAERVAAKRQLVVARHAAALRGELDWIVMRAIERERSRRYPSASELAADVERYLEGEAVLARPPSTVYRLTKLMRRHRVTFAMIVGVFIALVLGLGVVSNLYLRAEHERRRAEWQTYLSSIRAASASLRDGEVREAQRWLAACAPGLRGWEWDHLFRRTDASLFVLRGIEQRGVWAGFSPDGRTLAATSSRGVVRLWSWGAGEPKPLRSYRTPGENLSLARYSPDGDRLAIGAVDSTVVIWDVATGILSAVYRPTIGYLLGLAWSPDGQTIAISSDRASISVIESSTGVERLLIPLPNVSASCVIYSRGGGTIFVGRDDGVIHEFDARSGGSRGTFVGHEASVIAIASSPDGGRIVSVSIDQTVRVWDVRSRRAIAVLRDHRGNVNGVSFRPDGRFFATASYDKTVRIWDAVSLRCTRVLTGHEAYIYPVDYSPDGRYLVSGSDDETVRIWDTAQPENPTTLAGEANARAAVPLPEGRLVAADGTGRLLQWSSSGSQPDRVVQAHAGDITQLSVANGGRVMASLGVDHRLVLWKQDLQPIASVDIDSLGAFSASLGPTGDRVAVGRYDGRVEVHGLVDRAVQRIGRHPDMVQGVVFSPDGATLASSSWRGGIVLWNLASGDTIVARFPRDAPMRLAFSRDGRYLVVGTWSGKVQIRDAKTLRLVHDLSGHSSVVFAVAFSPDGQRVASASQDRTVRLWDPVTGEPLLTLEGHSGGVNSVSFSEDGNAILTASDDRTVRVWRR